MSENWDDFDNDQSQTQQQPPRENNTIKTLREMHDADNARIKALEEKLTALEADKVKNQVGSMLESHGLPPRAAKLYQGEATPDAVAAWAEENKDLFNVQPGTPTPTVNVGPSITPAESMSQQQKDEYQRVLDAGVDGVKPAHFTDAMGALLAASTREELQEVYRRFG